MGDVPAVAALGLLGVVGLVVPLVVRLVGAVRRRRMPEPHGQPLERLAGSLRRVRTELRRPAPGMSAVRRRGLCMAYDDLLDEACRALDIDHELHWLTGFEQEMERLRVEDALTRAGIQLGDDPGREPDGGCADESNAA